MENTQPTLTDETTEDIIDRELKPFIKRIHNRIAADGYTLSDEEVLGIIVAKYFRWEGTPILKTAAFAMEDANYKDDYNTLMAMATD